MRYNSLDIIKKNNFDILVRNIPNIYTILLQVFYKLLFIITKNYASYATVTVTKVIATSNTMQYVCYGINTSQFLVNTEWMG